MADQVPSPRDGSCVQRTPMHMMATVQTKHHSTHLRLPVPTLVLPQAMLHTGPFLVSAVVARSLRIVYWEPRRQRSCCCRRRAAGGDGQSRRRVTGAGLRVLMACCSSPDGGLTLCCWEWAAAMRPGGGATTLWLPPSDTLRCGRMAACAAAACGKLRG